MPASRHFARQPDVSIEQAANGIGNRLLRVVSLDKHRIKARNATASRPTSALDQLRQHAKYRRRITAGRGRLAGCEADFCVGPFAKRVSESINNSTSRPVSRKYSAMAVAVWAACTRSSAGSSLVATTTTLRARALRPRDRVRETHLPRGRGSPTNAITFTLAAV